MGNNTLLRINWISEHKNFINMKICWLFFCWRGCWYDRWQLSSRTNKNIFYASLTKNLNQDYLMLGQKLRKGSGHGKKTKLFAKRSSAIVEGKLSLTFMIIDSLFIKLMGLYLQYAAAVTVKIQMMKFWKIECQRDFFSKIPTENKDIHRPHISCIWPIKVSKAIHVGRRIGTSPILNMFRI